MSAPASPMKPAKVPKPEKPVPPPPPKVVAPPVEEDDDDLPPPDDDPEDEAPVVATPPPVPIVAKKPTNSPPPPPKAAKAAPITPPPSDTIESTVDRKGVKSFVNPALAGKASSVPRPVPASAPSPPPRASSAKSSSATTEKSEDTETGEDSAKRGSIFTSVSHGLRKALRNSLISTGGDGGASPAPVVDENILKEGKLSKMNREGKFEKYKIVLRKDEFFYTQDKDATGGAYDDEPSEGGAAATTSSSTAASTAEHDRHEIPLVSMIVLELHDKDLLDSEKRARCFKLLSKTKSFYLRAKTEELKNEWFQEMFTAVKTAQDKANVSPQLEDMAPLWNIGDTNCQLCGKAFSFFTRKHHCRNCGKCVCELCSRDKVRILRIDDKKLFKVCNPCGEEIKNNRRYGV